MATASGAEMKERIGSEGAALFRDARSEGKVVLVAKSGCTFCARARTILEGLVRPERLAILDVEKLKDGPTVRELARAAAGGHKTVPMVFHGDKFLGGCDQLVAMEGRGELRAELGGDLALAAEGEKPRARMLPPVSFPLFFFPPALNGVAARFAGFQAVCCCVLAVIWREEPWTGWLMLGLGLDFFIRLVAGGTASPVGAVSAILSLPFRERLVAGPQKQFAALLGCCFASTTGALLLARQDIAGAVVAAMLLGAAGLEAFLDFCAGCFMFTYMIKFGFVTSKVNDMAISQKSLMQAQMDHQDDFSGELRPLEEYVHRQPGQPETPADLRVKFRKTDEHKRRGFHPVKHVAIGDFMMPLGIAALAMAWKLGNYTPALETGRMCGDTTWRVLMWISVGLSGALLALLFAKLLIFPRKLLKEVSHPMKSGNCATLPTCLVIYAFLLWDSDDYDTPDYDTRKEVKQLCVVLFWIGAALLKALMVYRLAWVVGNRANQDHKQAQILLPIIGCMVAAMVAPIFDGFDDVWGYTELGWFFFGLAAVLSVVLMGGTLLEAVSFHWSDERTRVSMGMWVVALQLPFLAHLMLRVGPAAFYTAGSSGKGPSKVSYFDAVEHTLFFAGCSTFLVLFWLAVPMGFLIKLRFDFSFWALAFPLDVLAMSCMVYAKSVKGTLMAANFSSGLAYATLAIASYGNAVLFLNTAFWLLKRRWLRPETKWAPLSLNKLTHEAFRVAGAKLAAQASALGDDMKRGGQPLGLARSLADEWELYGVTLEWHAHQEDQIMFREIDAFNPMATRDGYVQHEQLEHMEHKLNDAMDTIKQATEWSPQAHVAAQIMVDELAKYVPFMEKHMDWEEENLLALNRRTFNMDIQIRIVRKIWDAYEAMSVEEFRAKVQGLERPSSGGDPKSWSSYDLAQFTKTGRYGYPSKEGDLESALGFPPTMPEGKMPLSKQQVWRVVLPYVVRNLPEPMMRTRFVRCWAWALPERAQHVGEMIYRGLEDADWTAIAKDVPEVIPRGLPGWVRRV